MGNLGTPLTNLRKGMFTDALTQVVPVTERLSTERCVDLFRSDIESI